MESGLERRTPSANEEKGGRDDDALPTDDEVIRLFDRVGLAEHVHRMIRNDPGHTTLTLSSLFSVKVDLIDEEAWRVLGRVIGRCAILEDLTLRSCSRIDMEGFCEDGGLNDNRRIESIDVENIDMNTERMGRLAPFLSDNFRLCDVSFTECSIGAEPAGSLGVLSDALRARSADTVYRIDLSGNNFGDISLDKFVWSIEWSWALETLSLSENGIGHRGCVSLANLLKNRHCNLEELYLCNNSIEDEGILILVDSLSSNTKLKCFDLEGNDDITARGWRALLGLVCRSSSTEDLMKSNHTLYSIGLDCDFDPGSTCTLTSALGADDSNLLNFSLMLNADQIDDNNKAIRVKILWSHMRGDLELGNCSIPPGAMPPVLACVGGGQWPYQCDSDYEYYLEHLDRPPGRLNAIRLNAIYRITRSMPVLFG